MHFTREPIIETIIVAREDKQLTVRKTNRIAEEEGFSVDSVQIINFGGAYFYRSVEQPYPFLVPARDYEIIEEQAHRASLKNTKLGIKTSSKKGDEDFSPSESRDHSASEEKPSSSKKKKKKKKSSSDEKGGAMPQQERLVSQPRESEPRAERAERSERSERPERTERSEPRQRGEMGNIPYTLSPPPALISGDAYKSKNPLPVEDLEGEDETIELDMEDENEGDLD